MTCKNICCIFRNVGHFHQYYNAFPCLIWHSSCTNYLRCSIGGSNWLTGDISVRRKKPFLVEEVERRSRIDNTVTCFVTVRFSYVWDAWQSCMWVLKVIERCSWKRTIVYPVFMRNTGIEVIELSIRVVCVGLLAPIVGILRLFLELCCILRFLNTAVSSICI